MTTAWFCELHRLTTTTDCPKCDDEQIAILERYQRLPTCHACGRTIYEGEQAWVSDWLVIEQEGLRSEARYTCDGCTA
jgi:hypothetical protein